MVSMRILMGAALLWFSVASAVAAQGAAGEGRVHRASRPASVAVRLRSEGPGRWRMPSGLRFDRSAARELQRRSGNARNEPRPFGVFHGGARGAFSLVNEAWAHVQANHPGVTVRDGDDGVKFYQVPMGRRVGLVHGSSSAAYSVRLAVRGHDLLGAYPAGSRAPARENPVIESSTPWTRHDYRSQVRASSRRTVQEIAHHLQTTAGLRADTARAAAAHVRLGLPTPVERESAQQQLIVRRGYVGSYNPERRVANWVSYRVTHRDLGRPGASNIRRNNFRADMRLPIQLEPAHPDDYRGSGLTRGHLVPSGARQTSRRFNGETFLMSNMVPQTESNNSGPWNDLERFVRQEVAASSVAHVIAGPGFNGPARTIGESPVAVPDFLWKVVVLLPPGQSLRTLRAADARVVTIRVPNRNDVQESANPYRTSVAALQRDTGFRFFTHLPPRVARLLRRRSGLRIELAPGT